MATPIADMSATHFAVVKRKKDTADHRRRSGATFSRGRLSDDHLKVQRLRAS
jgi:hypothetical protein